jgi:carboxymethylenebutenolidase
MCFQDEDCDPEVRDRREFLLMALAGSLLFTATGAGAAEGQPPTRVLDDRRVRHGTVRFAGRSGEVGGYLARPRRKGRFPGVLVIAGNRITEEYIPNTCAALALAGYVGMAPDIYHTVPDSAQTPEAMNKALEGHTEDDFLADIRAGAEFLGRDAGVARRPPGLVGFCAGGRRALLYAARHPGDAAAVVAYHPGKTTREEIAGLRAPVQIHCGTADRHVKVEDVRELEAALRAQGTPVEVHLYEGADHGFLAYTRPFYRPADAELSWRRTVAFLRAIHVDE